MRRVVVAIATTLALTCLSPFTQQAQAASDGVGVVTNGLQLFYDAANYYSGSGTTVNDLSGNGRNATMIQTSSQPSTNSANGGYYSFNASGGYIDAPDLAATNSGWSVTFYANFGTTANNFERIIDFGNGSANNNVIVGREGTGTNLFIESWNGNSSPGYCRVTGGIDTSWHFWVVTLGGGYCNVWKDNTQVITNAAYNSLPAAVTWTNVYIGKSNWADDPFEGGIAELAFYNRVITGTEGTQNYNAAMDQTAPTYTGSSTFSVAENTTAVGTLTASESVVFIPLTANMDTNKFSISGSSLSFSTAPNFEANGSVNGNNTYLFYLQLMDLKGNVSTSVYLITITVTNVAEYGALTNPAIAGTIYKGVVATITVTPTVAAGSAAGKVSYFMAGKRIPGCYKKTFSGSGNSTCSWKPPTMGNEEISVTYTPTNTEYAATTTRVKYWIVKRTTNR